MKKETQGSSGGNTEILHHQGMFFHSLSYTQSMKCTLLSLTVRYLGHIKRKVKSEKKLTTTTCHGLYLAGILI
jgi:hypothetical protein